MKANLHPFENVWLVDCEFCQPDGEQPRPLCMVAKELRSNRVVRVRLEEGRNAPPLPFGPDDLLVAYLSSAELSCFLALGWELPDHVLDLYAEFRNHTNGLTVVGGHGLSAAMRYFGEDIVDVVEKEIMRKLAMRGRPYTDDEWSALLDYCERDVLALGRLLGHMIEHLDIDRALLRGRYMKAVSHVERWGVPIDKEALDVLLPNWTSLRGYLIGTLGAEYGVFRSGSFNLAAFDGWLAEQGISWPRTETGKPKTDGDTFREMARHYPQLVGLKDLLYLLSQLRLSKLTVGEDGRNRCLTGVFGSRTSRNQPSASKWVFGSASWIRGLIRARLGWGLGYVDFEQQEFGIAASLSGDQRMLAAYSSGDTYLSLGVQLGVIPAGGDKVSHRHMRNSCKVISLGTLYGMGAQTLARRLDCSHTRAQNLLQLHRHTYAQYWSWLDAVEDIALRDGHLQTVFGWRLHVTRETKDRTLRNFLIQASGAEILRTAVILAVERGVRVVAMVHDAILIEAPEDKLENAVAIAQSAMAEASSIVLGGLVLRTEAKVARHPDRLLSLSDNGRPMWNRVWQGIKDITGAVPAGITIEEEK